MAYEPRGEWCVMVLEIKGVPDFSKDWRQKIEELKSVSEDGLQNLLSPSNIFILILIMFLREFSLFY